MKKLRIAFLSYRSNPYSGGQGIYVKYVTKALADLGHEVTVFSGPPYPDLDSRVKLEVVPSLDLYSKDSKFKDVKLKDLFIPINFFEWFSINSGGFAEPYTFGKRVKKILKYTKNKQIKIGYKFGLEFLNSKGGRNFIKGLKNKIIFLDTKLNDIPNTMRSAVIALKDLNK